MFGFLGMAVSILIAVFFFSLAIFVHEFGHFIAARLLGFQVDVFSIGFGPALWQRRVNGVLYKFSAIPFGGYVAIPQLDPSGMEKLQGEGGAAEQKNLPDMPAWKKIVVALCGPLGNVGLAVMLACAICWFAPADSTGGDTSIGFVQESSDAYAAGLRTGDQILGVNGTPVASWNDFGVETHLSAAGGKTVALSVLRDGKTHAFNVPVTTMQISPVDSVSRIDGILPKTQCLLGKVYPDSPAVEAGLREGDILLEVNGLRVFNAGDALKALAGAPPLALTLRRGAETVTAALTPRVLTVAGRETERPMVGIELGTEVRVRRPWMQERAIGAQLRYDADSIFRLLRALFHPKHEGESGRALRSLGGPVMIATALYHEVRNDFWSCLGFIRFICINLAVLNLLPVPVLDGGHILFALYSLVTRRRPNARVVAVLVNTFAILFIGLMLLVVFRDTLRFLPAKTEEAAAEVSQEPPTDPLPAALEENAKGAD